MPHLAQSFRLDLPNAFARDAELPANFFECPAVTVDEAEALLEHLAFALGERLEHVLNLLLEENNRGHVARIFGAFVFDEITEVRLFAFADRRLQ